MQRPFKMPTTNPPPREHVIALFVALAVLRQGHFVYVAGDHAGDYFQKNLILSNPYAAAGVAFHMAAKVVGLYPKGAILIAPASGGIGLVQLVADAATRMNEDGHYWVLYADKDVDTKERFIVNRNAHLLDLELPLVGIEDVVTTGGSIAAVQEAVGRYNCRLFDSIQCICDRGVDMSRLKSVMRESGNLGSFIQLNTPRYKADECPLCAQGMEIDITLGHGKDFVKKHGQPPYPRA